MRAAEDLNFGRALQRMPPRKLAATSHHPNLRWWQIAHHHLWRLVMSPVDEDRSPGHRFADVMGLYGLRVESTTGNLHGYRLSERGRWLIRVPMGRPDISIDGSPRGDGWLRMLIDMHSNAWANLAGMPTQGRDSLPRLRERLRACLMRRWALDGTLVRMRRLVARAFALDPEVVHLAQLSTLSRLGHAGADEGDYNRCLRDRLNLLTLAREAPQLMRWHALFLPMGAGVKEPKKELRRSFISSGEHPPRLWRLLCRYDAATIDSLIRKSPARGTHLLHDLVDFLGVLDPPIDPPRDWLELVMDRCGDELMSSMFGSPAHASMLREHLRVWCSAAVGDHDTLAAGFVQVDEHLMATKPMAPTGVRHWSWWLRNALAWHTLEAVCAEEWDRNAIEAEPAPQPPIEGDGLIALQLLTATSLHLEGREMAHCIYQWRAEITSRKVSVYSVRESATNKRIATVAVDSTGEFDARGFANREVPAPLRARIGTLLTAQHRRGGREVEVVI